MKRVIIRYEDLKPFIANYESVAVIEELNQVLIDAFKSYYIIKPMNGRRNRRLKWGRRD